MTSLRDEIHALRDEQREDMTRVHERLDELRGEVQSLRESRAWVKGAWVGVSALAGAAGALAAHFLPVLLVLLAGCAASEVPAARSWGSVAPVDLTIDTAMAPECTAVVKSAVAFWAKYTDRLEVRYERLGSRESNFAEIVVRQAAPGQFPETIAGITGRWTSGFGQLLRARVYLRLCARETAIHEIGHALGLEDTANYGYAMYYGYPPGGVRLTRTEVSHVRFWR